MKFFKNKLAVTIIVLSVTFLGLIGYSVKSSGKGLFEDGAGSVLNPVQKFVYGINSKAKNFVDFLLNFSDVKEENEKLTWENSQLKDKFQEYKELEEENERLRAVLDLRDSKKDFDYIATNIVGHSGGSILDGYIVDKGTKEGVQEGMVVISAAGLVGQVTSVGSNWSIIQPLTNENIAVAIKVENTGEVTGILQGYKDGKDQNLTVAYNLPIDSKVKAGDVILTSGLGGVYPKDLRVGEVVSVEEDNVRVMKSAIVKPYADFNKLEELFIIVPKTTRNIQEEE